MKTEREAALLVVSSDPDLILRRLSALRNAGAYALVPRGAERFRDTYFDTPGGDLGAKRIALRIRDFGAGERALTTLKTPARGAGRVAERGELEVPLTETGARKVLAQLQRLGVRASLPSAREFVKGGERAGGSGALLRASQVRTNRRLLRDVEKNGKRVAELAIDRVSYSLGDTPVRFEEVEIEAKDSGTAGDVERIARALLDEFGRELRPWRASKLAVGKTLEAWSRKGQLAPRLTSKRGLDPAWLPHLARAGARN